LTATFNWASTLARPCSASISRVMSMKATMTWVMRPSGARTGCPNARIGTRRPSARWMTMSSTTAACPVASTRENGSPSTG
jgi:hypothetical protein